MKLSLNTCESTTGWTASTGATLVGTTTEEVSNGLSAALVASFTTVAGSYIDYTFSTPIAVSSYTHVRLHIMSQKKGEQKYTKASDHSYSISFGSGKVFYLPVYEDFTDVSICIEGITTLEKIRITKEATGEDYIVVSGIMACAQELPLDIYIGVKEEIEDIIAEYSKTLIGTISTTAGGESITFPLAPPYIDRYAVIEITNGVLTETHHILYRDSLTFRFGDLYDGELLVNTMASASVYLVLPVIYGVTTKEIMLPSISIWGFNARYDKVTNELHDRIETTKSDGSFITRKEGVYTTYPIFIDCEAREVEIMALCAEIVRKFISRKIAWVCGLKCFVNNIAVNEIELTEAYDVIPKIEFENEIGVKEDVWTKKTTPKTSTIDVDVDIQ